MSCCVANVEALSGDVDASYPVCAFAVTVTKYSVPGTRLVIEDPEVKSLLVTQPVVIAVSVHAVAK